MPDPDFSILGALERLPTEALADLIERLIDRLDAAEPDPDIEEDNEDCCEVDDEHGCQTRFVDRGAGDPDDAERDDEDRGAEEDEPDFTRRGRRASDVRRPVRVPRKRAGQWTWLAPQPRP